MATDILKGHPTTWIGKTFTYKATGESETVLKVVQNGKRFTVLMDSENPHMRYMGFDSRLFREIVSPV